MELIIKKEGMILMDDELLKKYGYVLSSSYRVRVMKALEYDIKTPTNIAKEAGITSNHISRVLGELKDADLAECLNEEEWKGRLYRLTEDGKEIMENLD